MNAIHLLASIPWSLIAGLLLANVIPYLSALATKAPSWATGVVTMVLAFVDGLLSEVANTSGPINWRAVLGTAFTAWAVAALHHSKVLKGTRLEDILHALPKSLPHLRITTQPAQPAPPAV